MNSNEKFQAEIGDSIRLQGANRQLRSASTEWIYSSSLHKYSYNFSWMGRPIIQYPQDIVALQELVFRIRPDLIIETGIAHGGSLILSASMLALLEYCDAASMGISIDPKQPTRMVLGVDIDIREHNRQAIEAHPIAARIQMIQGSSIAPETIGQVRAIASRYHRVLVLLDSNHTRDHVLAELEAYAPLVSPSSYCVVFDTVIEHMPASLHANRPWGPGNSPMTAAGAFLSKLRTEQILASDGAPLAFEVDTTMDDKLLISVAPGGYLRRVP